MTEQELRELDAWIEINLFRRSDVRVVNETFGTELEWDADKMTPRLFTSGPTAMLVLEKCAEGGILNGDFKLPVSIFQRGDKQWVISENTEDEEDLQGTRIVAEAATLPLAICLFAKQLFSK